MQKKKGSIFARAVWVLSIALLATLFSFQAAAQQHPDLAKADALIKGGKPAEAYALLQPLEDKLAGDPQFDYLLGIAALDSGKADRATLALERVLAVNPNFAGARLDLARAYFLLGDMARAKTEFETVRGQNPPPEARATIERYLQQIAEREKVKTTNITAFIEGTIGHDSNVNNSTSQTQIAVPALNNVLFTLSPTNVKRSDSYGILAAGADIAHEIRPGIALFAGVSGRYRGNSSADVFDYKSAELHGGAAYVGETNIVRATLNGEDYYLDHALNRNTVGAGADWRHILNPANHLNLFGQYSRFRFEQAALTVNNFDLSVGGLGWTRIVGEGRGSFSVTLLGGKENDTNDRADGNKEFYGLRLGGQYNLMETLEIFASVGRQNGNYDKVNAAFRTTRDDTLTDGIVGLNWRLARDWTVRPQVLYVRNDSNIPIYAYTRYDFSITLRRDFR